jgi:hypothetical protein
MQNVIAILIVAMAAVYLGWRGWCVFARKRAAGCGSGCGSCPVSQSTGATETLVTIKPLAPTNDRN